MLVLGVQSQTEKDFALLELIVKEAVNGNCVWLCIGEGNGNPPQCSSLENPRDGVAQSQTRLK